MATGDPQLTFPRDFRLQKLYLKFSKPRASDIDVKITMTGNNGRKVESEQRFKVEKATTLESVECGAGGMVWPKDIGNFRIDGSTAIQIRLRKAGSTLGFLDTRESSVIRWSYIKAGNHLADDLVYETEDSSLKATVRLHFQTSSAEIRFHSIEGSIQKATLSQDHREETTSKFKSIDDTLKPILDVLEKVAQIHPAAIVVVGLVKMAHDRLLNRQIKYDEVVRSLLQCMTDIQPFARVASMNQSSDLGLVRQTIAEMLSLIQDACKVIATPNNTRQEAHLNVLTAVSRENLVREFKQKLDIVIRNFNMSLNTEVHAKVMNAEQKAEATEIKEWLTSLDVIKRFNGIISTHVPGTGSWFLEREDIRTWMEGESGAFRLFCRGIPGCGKTMMISLVCKTLLQKYQKRRSTAILRFYFDHKDPQTHSFDEIILSFTRQLIRQGHLTPDWIRNYYQEHTDFKDINILRIQLSAHLKSSYSEVFILADAMDECPPSIQRRLLDFLKLLAVNTHILITSRPGQGEPEDLSLWAIVNLQANSDDVLKYIEQRLSDSDDPDLLKNQEDLRTDIKEKVLMHADGVMLLAKLHMDAITAQNTLAGLIHVLETLPKGLVATFEDTVQRIKKQKSNDAKLAVKILMWIVGAERPLSVRELQCAAALELTEPCFDERAQPTTTTMTRVCAGLVAVDDKRDVFRLVLQEYFNGVREVFFDDMTVQLASLCLNYLLSISFQGVIYGDSLKRSMISRYNDNVPAFLEYCSTEWPRHSSGCQLQVLDLILEVLQNDVAVKHSFNAINLSRRWWEKLDGTALHLLVYHGLQEVLNFILFTGKSDMLLETPKAAMHLVKAVQDRNSKGRTPLSYAAEFGHPDVVKVLLEKREVTPDDKDKTGRSPLSHAAAHGFVSVVNALLVKDEVEADGRDDIGRSPLSHAAGYGHLDVVNALLVKDKVEVNGRDMRGRSPLSYAAGRGHLNVVNALLAKDEDGVDGRDNGGRSPLSYAAEDEHLDVVNALLVKDKVEVNGRDMEGRSPLSYAAGRGHLNVVNTLLLKDEVEVDGRDKAGRTPLSYTAETGCVDVMNALLMKGEVEVDGRDKGGRSPLSYAAGRGLLDVVNTLLLKDEVEVDGRDKGGRSPLSYAAGRGHLNVVNTLLLKDEVEVDGRDKAGRTPLSYAAETGCVDVMNALLMKGEVEVDGRDKGGRSPLSHAAGIGASWHPEAIKLLLAREEVRLNGKDNAGRTPLSYAAGSPPDNHEVIHTLLAQSGIEVNEKDNIGRSPLCYAAIQGNPVAMKALLSQEAVEADGKDDDGRTALSHAVQSTHRTLLAITILLDQEGVDVNSKDNLGRTPLSYTAERIDSFWGSKTKDVFKVLAQHGIKVDERDSTGRTPLSYAAQSGNLAVVNHLIAKVEVEIDGKDNKGRSALSYSAEYGHVDVVNALLAQKKVMLNDKDERGKSALTLAAQYGRLDVVTTLLAQDGVEVDERDKEGGTPFSYAAECGDLDVAKCLIDQDGVDGDSKDSYTLLFLAAQHGHADLLKALLARGKVAADSKDEEGRTALSHGAQNGHISAVKELLMQDKVDANSRDKNGRVPLSYAAMHGHLVVVKELLKRDGVEPDCHDMWRKSPFTYAAEYGHLHVVTTLLALDKVQPGAKAKWGGTPLMCAADNGHLDVVKTLMADDRIDLNDKDKWGRTALLYAAWSGHVPVVNTLIGHEKVDRTVRDKKGATLLAYAAGCTEGKGDMADIILALDQTAADVEDMTGRAPISYAAYYGNLGAVRALLAREDVKIDRKHIKGKTPLWMAAQRGHVDVVIALLAHGNIDINSKNYKGRTPLSTAARFGHVDVIEALLTEDAVELNSQDNDVRTPLSYAAEEGRTDVVRRLLLVEGIAVHLANKSGSPPIWYAELNGHSEIVAMLEKRGAVPELADTLAALFTCELICTLCLMFYESAHRFISE